MNDITIFDTAIASDNIGDEIIMDAVNKHLLEVFPSANFLHLPTHISLNGAQLKLAQKSEKSFVGGTNLLCGNWLLKPQWKVGLRELFYIKNPILLGVGWRFYQRPTDFLTKIYLKKLLNKKYLHSVRDSYTLARVQEMGIKNVINTACPTMWKLTPEHCAKIPTQKASSALITVTAYRNDPEIDRKWLEIVLANYEKIYLFPQMVGDVQYVQNMNLGRDIKVISPSLAAYDQILARENLDYIGTRLHGGIRALQHGRRSLIIEVDNRATEIARDTNLPTAKRDDFSSVKHWIENDSPTIINLPLTEIDRWKAQFTQE